VYIINISIEKNIAMEHALYRHYLIRLFTLKHLSIHLPALLVSSVLLSACGIFGADNSYSADFQAPTLAAKADITNVSTIETLTSLTIGAGGLSLDEDGFIYASHFGQGIGIAIDGDRVLKIDPVTGRSEIFASGFNGATGSDFDSQGNFYQASFSNHTLYKIAVDGTMTTVATKSNGLKSPVGVVIDKNDNVYVNNCGGGNITKISSSGIAEIYAQSTLLNCANGLTIDDDSGILYVANFSDSNVLKVTTNGSVSLLATLSGSGNGHLTLYKGSLYVAQFSINKISKVSLTGKIVEFIGNGNDVNEDGNLLAASVRNPNDLVFDAQGNLFIFASANEAANGASAPSIIRKVTNTL
jgi:sugar lactone lactonase YvrE